MPNPVDFKICLITDRTMVALGHTLLSALEAAMSGGITAVQLREKDLPAAALLPLARELRDLTRRYDARLLINDRIDLALAVQADGVHLGGHSMPADVVRRLTGPDMLIGVSTHSVTDVQRAAELGADFVTFGPVYATPSKAAYGPPQGLQALAEACLATSLPVFALGGITPQRLSETLQTGVAGIALISAILAAPDPCKAAIAFYA
jgi:thiamine-phosphate pyrophosphorylase